MEDKQSISFANCWGLLPMGRRRLAGLLVLLSICLSLAPAQAQDEGAVQYTLSLAVEVVEAGDEVDLLIDVTNPGPMPVRDETLLLYLSEGLTLAAGRPVHDLYQPLLSRTLSLGPGQTVRLVAPLYVFEQASSPQAAALVRAAADGRPERMLARLEIPVAGAPPPISIQVDYEQPEPPQVSCTAAPGPLSSIGNVVSDTLKTAYYSSHTHCNKFSGDWILDVPNVSPATPPTSAEQFYSQVAALIEQTSYTFSLSTLWFQTHAAAAPEHNLVRHYLAPAILNLHNATPDGGPYPLLRFAYAPAGLSSVPSDALADVYQDLTALLPDPQVEAWRVSIAVAGIGTIPTSPWNHSKIAVRDYRQAIVGGMNWELNYVVSVDVDGNGTPDQTVEQGGQIFQVNRLYDLSAAVEGEAARAAGVYFDKLWRRNIDPAFPHFSNDCRVSWPISFLWISDCSLEATPAYAPPGGIPDYELDSAAHIFSLGRGHTDWWPSLGDSVDFSADAAVLAVFAAAEQSIYINQHQLSNPALGYTEVVVAGLVQAIVDRQVQVKVILSEPWGSGAGVIPAPDSVAEVFAHSDNELFTYAQAQYGWETEEDQQQVYEALCRLAFAPFRVTTPNPENQLFHTHNKFFMIDSQTFYVGSQNLYPSAIGDTSAPELNEYGYLIDDADLAAEIEQAYWQPVWEQIEAEQRRLRSDHLPEGYLCAPAGIDDPAIMYLPLVVK